MPLVDFRKTEVVCPKCREGHLTAVSIMNGSVKHYNCDKCPAYYDAEVYHDFPRNEHWWVGKLRNPDFWDYPNSSIEEGVAEMFKKQRQGVPDYVGIYPIEKIDAPKKLPNMRDWVG